ncbi:hypothetical protein BSKO_10939 [Bryopsis sp. KO-2023]|nr:hypothetical protein BSKO_10939 [Bryopsis sp. KO-2023]
MGTGTVFGRRCEVGSGAKNEEAKSLEEVFERWGRHTKHCKHCKKTAKDLIFLGSMVRKVAVASLIASGVSLLVSGLKAKPCIAGLVIAGLVMLATRTYKGCIGHVSGSVAGDGIGSVRMGQSSADGFFMMAMWDFVDVHLLLSSVPNMYWWRFKFDGDGDMCSLLAIDAVGGGDGGGNVEDCCVDGFGVFAT